MKRNSVKNCLEVPQEDSVGQARPVACPETNGPEPGGGAPNSTAGSDMFTLSFYIKLFI